MRISVSVQVKSAIDIDASQMHHRFKVLTPTPVQSPTEPRPVSLLPMSLFLLKSLLCSTERLIFSAENSCFCSMTSSNMKTWSQTAFMVASCTEVERRSRTVGPSSTMHRASEWWFGSLQKEGAGAACAREKQRKDGECEACE